MPWVGGHNATGPIDTYEFVNNDRLSYQLVLAMVPCLGGGGGALMKSGGFMTFAEANPHELRNALALQKVLPRGSRQSSSQRCTY